MIFLFEQRKIRVILYPEISCCNEFIFDSGIENRMNKTYIAFESIDQIMLWMFNYFQIGL